MAGSLDRRDLPAQTSLRGLAAFLVFIAHSQVFLLFPGSALAAHLQRLFHWNNEAVDLFFVLSGFILHYVYGESPADWRKYAWARFSRIYPLYLASTAFFLALAALQYFTTRTLPDKFGTLNILSNLFLLQSWPWPWPALSLNYPAWSISVEAFLYIFVFPPLFYAARRFRMRDLPAWALGVGIYLFMGFLWMLHREFEWMTVHRDFTHGFRNAWLRGICGFTAGYLLAVLASRWKFHLSLPRSAEALMLLGFALLLALAPSWAIAGLLLLSPILVYCAAVQSSLTTSLLSFRPLVYLGDLSYSIYVWHAPVLAVSSRFFHIRDTQTGELFATSPSILNIGCYLIFSLVGVLMVAHVSYFHFELPTKAALRKWTASRGKRANARTSDEKTQTL